MPKLALVLLLRGCLPCCLHRSQDGLLLTISSQDGYCTVLGFQEGELGTPLQIQGEHSLVT